MTAKNAYAAVLEQQLDPESFVRRGLAQLEFSFRKLALCALSEWQAAAVSSDDVFKVAAVLARPSWGSWNGLLSALRKARNQVLRGGGNEERRRVESATRLAAILTLLDARLSPALADALQPLAAVCRVNVRQPRLGEALAWPITLRNVIAHDAPTDGRFWSDAASKLRPLLEFMADADPVDQVLTGSQPAPPWCLEQDGKAGYFSGMTHNNSAVRYVFDDAGQTRVEESERDVAAVLVAVRMLMGREDVQEQDFRRLLTKLAPEEIRGVLLGDFLVGAPVAEGGFATVHRGTQLSTGRKVAVKVLRDGMDEEIKARFRQEAEVLSRLAHRNIVAVFGYGEDSWRAPAAFSLDDDTWFKTWARSSQFKLYMALEWVAGETLEAVYQRATAKDGQPIATPVLAQWFQQAASALLAVHSIGWMHRDVKPSNLMIDERGQLKLMDFGIARISNDARTIMTQTGRAYGTEPYMSPEQLAARDADSEVGPLTDVYSLCATFYELAALQRLYDHGSASTTVVNSRKLNGEPPAPLRRLRGKFSWELATLIMGGLQREPRLRPQSMEALERDLNNVLQDQPIAYKRPGVARRAWLIYKRNRAVSLVAGLGMALVVTITLAFIAYLDEARRDAEIAAADAKAAGGQYAALCDELTASRSEEQVDAILASYGGVTYRARLERRAALAKARIREEGEYALYLQALARTGSTQAVEELMAGQPAGPGSPPRIWAARRVAYFDGQAEISNTLGMRMARVKAGECFIGSSLNDKDEMLNNLKRPVSITRDFYVGIYEVTNAEYRRFRVGHDSGSDKAPELDFDNHPVAFVNWVDARDFCRWLSAREGLPYRLPTEAEWEYVARCGRGFEESEYTWELADGGVRDGVRGFPPPKAFANLASKQLWSDKFEFTAPVGSFRPNRWGVYDLCGNVWEWCWEWYLFRPRSGPDPGRAIEKAPPEGMAKILKGASYLNGAEGDRSGVRIAQKTQMDHSRREHNFGFRVVLEVRTTE